MHMNGLSEMIRLRGGVETLQSLALRTSLYWCVPSSFANNFKETTYLSEASCQLSTRMLIMTGSIPMVDAQMILFLYFLSHQMCLSVLISPKISKSLQPHNES